MSSHADAIAQAKTLEEISDNNMVNYFKAELEEIGRGVKATTVLNDAMLKTFVRIGILGYERGPRTNPTRAQASEY